MHVLIVDWNLKELLEFIAVKKLLKRLKPKVHKEIFINRPNVAKI